MPLKTIDEILGKEYSQRIIDIRRYNSTLFNRYRILDKRCVVAYKKYTFLPGIEIIAFMMITPSKTMAYIIYTCNDETMKAYNLPVGAFLRILNRKDVQHISEILDNYLYEEAIKKETAKEI
jgi:hypothetical protein